MTRAAPLWRAVCALGVLATSLAACADMPAGPRLVPLEGIEPGAGPVEDDDTQRLLSAVITGDLLVGGRLGERLGQTAGVEPAAGPTAARDAEDGDVADRQMRRQAAFDRLMTEQQRQRQIAADKALLFEAWMRDRIEPAPAERADVRRAQQLLGLLGYLDGPADGLYGPQTRTAIEAFETSRGLPVSGAVTPLLIERLALEL